jgi:hypothetical protein
MFYDGKHILASMFYFDSDMSKSTNTVVYFDWKTVIYIYVCRKCHTQFMLPMEKSVTFTSACATDPGSFKLTDISYHFCSFRLRVSFVRLLFICVSFV